MRKTRSVRLDTLKSYAGSGRPGSAARRCDFPNCVREGDFRAPKSRKRLRDYYWFCREHIEGYNKAWNYHDGMSEAELEAHLQAAVIGERPLWPLGARSQFNRRFDDFYARARDPFRVFEGAQDGARAHGNGRKPQTRPATIADQARAALGLTEPCDLATVKKHYKRLVKRYHPDANGGSTAAEETLKRINEAYSILKKQLAS